MQRETASRSSSYKYCTLRYVADWERDIEVPVGVAIWRAEPRDFVIRLPQKGEKIEDITRQSAPYVRAVESQINEWVASGRLPYAAEDAPVLSDEWWDHVRKLLRFRVRLDAPKPIDCVVPSREIHALFEAAVQPKQSQKRKAQNLDKAIAQALDRSTLHELESRTFIEGYKSHPVPVQKSAHWDTVWLVVEAVDLAGRDAERDADATASRVLRIKEGPHGDNVRFAIGYVASPNGLNGERVMKEWIELKSGTCLYDLTRERAEFNRFITEHFASLGPHRRVLDDIS